MIKRGGLRLQRDRGRLEEFVGNVAVVLIGVREARENHRMNNVDCSWSGIHGHHPCYAHAYP